MNIPFIKKDKLDKYWDSLKFAFYCMSHPMDGYWDLTHEKRGTYAAANTILIVTILVRLMSLKYTGFLIQVVNWERINIFLYIASIVFPLGLFVVGNWALTTLFDGKGRLGQVYMATCYAILPYSVIQVPIVILSNVVTVEESQFYFTLSTIALVYCGLLIIVAMGQIHEYSGAKNLLFMVASLVAMLIIIFILMLFFSMISQGVAYFVSLGKELLFRL
ncbi:MAG: YIP1 family protein [Lachnospiraceae bacterium]|nr:YIP1 family protein [Lachnospiraceae bacterium]MCR5767103.1 YIP1 family protein [Lachnospiraceae bacterium]